VLPPKIVKKNKFSDANDQKMNKYKYIINIDNFCFNLF